MALHEFTVSSVYARSAILIASVLCLGGCATVGPQSIAGGRGVYNEVINRTEDEQILNVLVRQRYDETFGMVSVASITANLRFSTRAEANIGIGDSDNRHAGGQESLSQLTPCLARIQASESLVQYEMSLKGGWYF